ncbi:hypothetical protein [Tsuneonella sp. HG222]
MRLRNLGIAAGVAMLSSLAYASTEDEALTPERDFSGVWVQYVDPSVPPSFAFPTPDVPFTPEGKRRRDEYFKVTMAGDSPFGGDNPGAHCVPYGMPTMMQMAGSYPIEFIHRPEQLTMIYEVESETRRVYMPSKATDEEGRFAVRQGYSEGHWEGNTLVVQTTDMTDAPDQMSYPHTDQASIVERFTLVPDEKVGKILEYEMTLIDPVYYDQPVSFTKKWMPMPNGRIMAYNCTEEPWLRLLEARRKQLEAGEPVTAKMSDVIDIYE